MKNEFSVKFYVDMGMGFHSDFAILPLKIVNLKNSRIFSGLTANRPPNRYGLDSGFLLWVVFESLPNTPACRVRNHDLF